MKKLFYTLCTLSVLGLIDLLTSASGSKLMQNFYDHEVERWGYVTIFLFEIGKATGSVVLLKLFVGLGGLMNQAWAFFGFIALIVKVKYLNAQNIAPEKVQ